MVIIFDVNIIVTPILILLLLPISLYDYIDIAVNIFKVRKQTQ